MGSVSVSSCRCCRFVSCVYPVAVLNAAFRDHMEEAYSRAMSVSFFLPHPVAASAFVICRGLCACTEMLWRCVLYVSFGCKVRPRNLGCVAMGSAFLCILGPDFSYILQGLA